MGIYWSSISSFPWSMKMSSTSSLESMAFTIQIIIRSLLGDVEPIEPPFCGGGGHGAHGAHGGVPVRRLRGSEQALPSQSEVTKAQRHNVRKSQKHKGTKSQKSQRHSHNAIVVHVMPYANPDQAFVSISPILPDWKVSKPRDSVCLFFMLRASWCLVLVLDAWCLMLGDSGFWLLASCLVLPASCFLLLVPRITHTLTRHRTSTTVSKYEM